MSVRISAGVLASFATLVGGACLRSGFEDRAATPGSIDEESPDGSSIDATDRTDSGSPEDAPDAGDNDASPAADAIDGDAGPGSDAGSPADFEGDTLFVELFTDSKFIDRGWYDDGTGVISAIEHIAGSSSAFECQLKAGDAYCKEGSPKRVLFHETDAIFVRFAIKLGSDFAGDITPLTFFTNEDDAYVGPFNSHLSVLLRTKNGQLRVLLTDTANVDPNCVRLTDGTVIGCGGDFSTYPFTEARSACACNTLDGDFDVNECSDVGGPYVSECAWESVVFALGTDAQVPYDTNWHILELYLRLNDIEQGIGLANGQIRLWVDGALVLTSNEVRFRTGQHPNMAFRQIMLEGFVQGGSPRDQFLWFDDLLIARGR